MPYRVTPSGEQYSSTSCLPVGSWSPMNCSWVSSGSRSMLQNCAAQSARHSGLPQTWSALDTPWNFRGATMSPLCSHTGLIGPDQREGDHFLGRIVAMGSLIWTKLETRIKWMEASQFSLSKESVPYTVCCESEVQCSVWHWWSNTALQVRR